LKFGMERFKVRGMLCVTRLKVATMKDAINMGGNSARTKVWEESKIYFVLMSQGYSATMVAKLDISCSFPKVHYTPHY